MNRKGIILFRSEHLSESLEDLLRHQLKDSDYIPVLLGGGSKEVTCEVLVYPHYENNHSNIDFHELTTSTDKALESLDGLTMNELRDYLNGDDCKYIKRKEIRPEEVERLFGLNEKKEKSNGTDEEYEMYVSFPFPNKVITREDLIPILKAVLSMDPKSKFEVNAVNYKDHWRMDVLELSPYGQE